MARGAFSGARTPDSSKRGRHGAGGRRRLHVGRRARHDRRGGGPRVPAGRRPRGPGGAVPGAARDPRPGDRQGPAAPVAVRRRLVRQCLPGAARAVLRHAPGVRRGCQESAVRHGRRAEADTGRPPHQRGDELPDEGRMRGGLGVSRRPVAPRPVRPHRVAGDREGRVLGDDQAGRLPARLCHPLGRVRHGSPGRDAEGGAAVPGPVRAPPDADPAQVARPDAVGRPGHRDPGRRRDPPGDGRPARGRVHGRAAAGPGPAGGHGVAAGRASAGVLRLRPARRGPDARPRHRRPATDRGDGGLRVGGLVAGRQGGGDVAEPEHHRSGGPPRRPAGRRDAGLGRPDHLAGHVRPRLRVVAAFPGAFARSLVRLRRFPLVLVAVLGAGAVVGIAAATGPMVVSSAGNEALSSRVTGSTGVPAGVRAEAQTPLTYDRLQFRLPLLRERLRGLPLPPPVVTVLGADEATLSVGGKRAVVQMVTRSGFLDHVERLAGDPSADGLWVAESAASELGLRPGDTATLRASEVATEIRVAGIYRDFDVGNVPDFWNPVIQRIRALPQDPDEPPLLLGNLRPYLDAEAGLTDQGTIAVDVAVPPDLPLRDARRVAGVISSLHDDVIVPESPVYGLFDVVDSSLPSLVEASDQTVATTTQPVQAISLAGELAALILAGAAGMFLARRRSVEFGLLSARGVGPVTIGLRTAAEALLPVALGVAAGLALARALTSATGPGGPVD